MCEKLKILTQALDPGRQSSLQKNWSRNNTDVVCDFYAKERVKSVLDDHDVTDKYFLNSKDGKDQQINIEIQEARVFSGENREKAWKSPH